MAESLRAAIETAELAGFSITVSIGAACCTEGTLGCETVIDLADKATYEAKRRRRNRVCTAHEIWGIAN